MRTQGGLSIQRMCELTGVSASFYRSRISVLLKREGIAVGAKKVRRPMRQDNLLAIRQRKFVVITDSDHAFEVYPNLAKHLELTDVNQLWVADLARV